MSDDVIRGVGGEVEESEGRRAESSGGRAAGWGAQQASAGFPRLLLTQLLTLFFPGEEIVLTTWKGSRSYIPLPPY